MSEKMNHRDEGQQEQEGKWILIPPTVLADDRLPTGAKLVYGRVLGLTKKYGYCNATSEYIGKQIGYTVRTVQNYLLRLYETGYLRYEEVELAGGYRERRIYASLTPEWAKANEEKREQKSGGYRNNSRGGTDRTVGGYRNNSRRESNISNKDKDSNISKGLRLNTEKGGERSADARRQRDPTATRKRIVEETNESTRGSGSPTTRKQTPTPKPIVKNEALQHPTPVYIGKPLTQEEIDEKRRHGQNASGYTPLSQIPSSHWQELETRAATHPTNGNGNGHHAGAHNGNGLHYSSATTHAPDFIDALIEQFSKLLHDEAGNIPQNINRAAKLYRQSEASEELFIASMHDAYTTARRKQKITTLHSDGRPNKMPYFFCVLADKLGVKPNQPT